MRNTDEKVLQEAFEMQAQFLENMLHLADKYDEDRDDFIKHHVQNLFITVSMGTFKNYEVK